MKIIVQQPHYLIEMFAPRTLWNCSNSDSFLVIVSVMGKSFAAIIFALLFSFSPCRVILGNCNGFYRASLNWGYRWNNIYFIVSIEVSNACGDLFIYLYWERDPWFGILRYQMLIFEGLHIFLFISKFSNFITPWIQRN